MPYLNRLPQRFHYPLYYTIFFTIALLICVPISLYMLINQIQLTAAFGMLGFSLFLLYMLYELTQTILIDRQGIALDSVLGELRRFAWNEIQGIKPNKNIFSPGFKVYNHRGDSIEISTTLGQYNTILELIRSGQAQFIRQPLATLDRNSENAISNPGSELFFQASKWLWLRLIMINVLLASLLAGTIMYSIWGGVLIFGGIFIIGLPYSIYDFLSQPDLVATRDGYLYIRFRLKLLNDSMRIKAVDVREVTLYHKRRVTPQGAVHASTKIMIYLWDKTEIDLTSISSNHEEMYLRLNAWIDQHSELSPAS